MTPSPASGLPHQKLEEILDARIQTLTTPHRYYRVTAHRFLAYLQTDFPLVLQLSELAAAGLVDGRTGSGTRVARTKEGFCCVDPDGHALGYTMNIAW